MKSRTAILIVGSVVGVLTPTVVFVRARWMDPVRSVSVAALIGRLQDDAPSHRRDAATTLGQIIGPGATSAADALIASLGDVDPEVRARSARSLGSLLAINTNRPRLDDAVSALTATLQDSVTAVRVAAAIGLTSIGRETDGMFEAAIEGLCGDVASLRAESATLLLGLTIREGAATRLGRSVAPNSAGRDLLMAALNDQDPTVRLAASTAMGVYAEDPIARFALQLATDDPDLGVRAAASASLAVGRLATRAEALADLRIALSHDPARVDLAAMIEADPDLAAPRLTGALRSADPRLRAAAARCLGEIVPDQKTIKIVVESLSLALTDRDPFVRRASAASLARYGPDAANAIDALKRASRDLDRGVSGQAFLTLRGLEVTRAR